VTRCWAAPFRSAVRPAQKAALERWERGEQVGDDGALARALVHANPAQPIPPCGHAAAGDHVPAHDVATRSHVPAHDVVPRSHVPRDVTVVVPTRDREVGALVACARRSADLSGR
jgi:hypothetical protein